MAYRTVTVTAHLQCPYCFKDCSVSDILACITSCLDENGELKQTHEYNLQMSVQMPVLNGLLPLLISSLVIM